MEKRALVAIVLSVIVIFAYDFMFTPTKKAPLDGAVSAVVTSLPQEQPASPVAEVAAAQPSDTAIAAGQVSDQIEQVVLENEKLVLTFDTWGARLISAQLKDYHERKPPQDLIELINALQSTDSSPLALIADTVNLSRLNYAYQADAAQVVFTAQIGKLELRKTFSLGPDSYLVKLDVEWQNRDVGSHNTPSYRLQWEPSIARDKDDKADEVRVVANINNEIRALKQKKIKQILYNQEHEQLNLAAAEKAQWIAISSQYFIASLITRTEGCFTRVEQIVSEAVAPIVNIALMVPPGSILQNNTLKQEFEIYLGPKDIKALEAVGSQMEQNIDFGFFGIFSKFLLVALRYIFKYVGNYGWSIIILSTLIKVVTYPLAQKSFVSMKRMQKITPLMNEIKEKYKGNQQQVNQEIMALYKRHKVNPMGGCLPMVIQMPVLFALFNTLRTSIELRGAPFIFWMTDLSQSDPYYILPVLMGLTMFLQQRMTPVTDPKQAKLMYFMPLVMTIMFMNLSSGLFIYFIVSNILTVTQQHIINKQNIV